ncbi:TonB-dependent receptor plug domain-containing protein [Pedobacter caeni]|uniref:TonB-dependent outer membrane receptor, SusC/RagA subfamily, signature region n=1 Tax=Pedobacter caeni TaxID=288992 RepID=A0A1M4UN58_9SPHI|nr:TonB-dependent receptor plug domain-containing protein [Pedobacter caeni]SHE58124.1 TonB-dependent outer membrane receptor, SusC/RagA subfamily, signature region [Pedobacter caeni]
MIGLKKLYITFLLTLVGSFAFSQKNIRMVCKSSLSADSLKRPLFVIVIKNENIILEGKKIDSSFSRRVDTRHIDKLDVLKDGAATALYGSRAQYGVVIVTMKKSYPRKAYRELQKYAAL